MFFHSFLHWLKEDSLLLRRIITALIMVSTHKMITCKLWRACKYKFAFAFINVIKIMKFGNIKPLRINHLHSLTNKYPIHYPISLFQWAELPHAWSFCESKESIHLDNYDHILSIFTYRCLISLLICASPSLLAVIVFPNPQKDSTLQQTYLYFSKTFWKIFKFVFKLQQILLSYLIKQESLPKFIIVVYILIIGFAIRRRNSEVFA